MTIRKERPKCRKLVESLLKQGFTLKQVANGYAFSGGLQKQAKKMLQEIPRCCFGEMLTKIYETSELFVFACEHCGREEQVFK